MSKTKSEQPINIRRRSFSLTNVHRFRDGRLIVYKQSNVKNWYAKFHTEGKYKVRSTGTTNFNTAKQTAMDWYDELRFNQRNGIPVQGLRFKDIFSKFSDYQELLVKSGELTAEMKKEYSRRLKGGIMKFFGDLNLQEITMQKLNEYKEVRIANDGVKHNTIRQDYNAIRQIIKYCVLQGHLKSIPEFPKKSKKDKTNPRPWFERDEWDLLKKTSKERIKKARGTRQKYERQQLHDFMVFMVHTGMRTEEILRTTFGNVKIYTKKDKSKELRITINGKTGIRKVRGMIGAVSAFQNLKKRNIDYKPTDLLFPQNHRDGLNNLLKETNLKLDKQGRARNSKSFRSTFIMYRLLAKQPIKAIATNCGTSTFAIDNFYAKHITIEMYDDSFTDLPE